MIGMLPPNKPGEAPSKARSQYFQTMARQARDDAEAELTEHDTERSFISLPVWKRINIMLCGPFINLMIALVLTAMLVMSVGVSAPTTTVHDFPETMTHNTAGTAINAERSTS